MLACDQSPTTVLWFCGTHPDHGSDGDDRDDDSLDVEHNLQLAGVDEDERQLHEPEEEEREEVRGGSTLRLGDLVREPLVLGPDSIDHAGNELAARPRVDGQPEACNDATRLMLAQVEISASALVARPTHTASAMRHRYGWTEPIETHKDDKLATPVPECRSRGHCEGSVHSSTDNTIGWWT